MSTEEKPQVLEEPQQTSLEETQETPSESSKETLLKESEEAPGEIENESHGCDGPNSHKWDNKMEVQRRLSGKPDLEITGTPEANVPSNNPKQQRRKKVRPEVPDKKRP